MKCCDKRKLGAHSSSWICDPKTGGEDLPEEVLCKQRATGGELAREWGEDGGGGKRLFHVEEPV